MIKKIEISDSDKASFSGQISPVDESLKNFDFKGLVVNKPWGYEYLLFQNKEIAIWVLYIKKGFSTSTHCHPNKKTSLTVILGEAKANTLNETFILKEKEGVIYNKGVFHTTEALSENGAFVIEVETPNNKIDLFRLKDRYKRETKGYSARKNVTDKIYNYYYQFLEDSSNQSKLFGKYKIFLKEYWSHKDLLTDIDSIDPDTSVIISGQLSTNSGKTFEIGDAIEKNDLKNCEIKTGRIKLLFFHERKKLIKLSDYVIEFLMQKGFDNAFLISGGNLMHLLESLRIKKMNYVCGHNEQAVSMSADGYARMTNKPGLLMVTSGPGGTNAITGVAGAWIDSIPLFIVSGQSYSTQTVGKTGLRQLGVQEINILEIIRPITKYTAMIDNPLDIKYHLEKAFYLATCGRPGPVWIDIPVNIQMAMIEEKELKSFEIPEEKINDENLREKVSETIEMIKNSKRPVLLLGNGVRLSHAEKDFFNMAEILSIPILTSRNANDLIWDSHPLYAGRPGSFGQRAANFTIQNSDLLLAIGSRLALALTGWAYGDFAREAKKIIVDIDSAELRKPTIKPDLAVKSNAKDFIQEMLIQLRNYNYSEDLLEWKEKIRHWKEKYPIVLSEYKNCKDSVNTYYFLDILSEELNEKDVIITDMGMSFQCTMQALRLKKGQRFFTESGHAAMGYGVPGAIGACIGNNKSRVICITGDGGLMMNIQELQTLKHHNLPIKLFIFNNKGYSSIRETQKTYFEGFIASEPSSGVSMPDFAKVAEAYGLKAKKINNQENLKDEIKEVLESVGPFVCELNVSAFQEVQPKQGAFNRPDGKTVPRPIEDMLPYIPREEFDKEMIIDPVSFDLYKGEN